jgi:hypothetical protein
VTGTKGKLALVRTRLDDWFFPQARPPARVLGRGEYALVLGALFVLGVIAELIRPGLAGSLQTVWAEDGGVVLQSATTHSFIDVVFTVYPEYLIVVPRMIGEVASWFPLRDAAVVITILSSAVIVLSGLVIWFASAGHIRNPYLRGTLAVVTVMAPVAGLEAVASAAYVSWYMLVAAFWILFFRPRTDWGAAGAAVFLLLAALSNPGIWFFAPIAGLRLLAIRDRRDAGIVVAYLIGAGMQAVASLQHPSPVTAKWTHEIWSVYLQRVLDGAVLGLRWGGDLWADFGWTLLIALLALSLAGLVAGLRRARPKTRAIVLTAVAISLLTSLTSMYQRAIAPALIWPTGAHFDPGGRYAIVPAMLLVVAFLAVLDDWLSRQGRSQRARGVVVAIAIVIPAIAVFSSFDVEENVARGTIHWVPQLGRAESACEAKPRQTAIIHTSPPGFGVILPCTVLTSNPAQPASGSP